MFRALLEQEAPQNSLPSTTILSGEIVFTAASALQFGDQQLQSFDLTPV